MDSVHMPASQVSVLVPHCTSSNGERRAGFMESHPGWFVWEETESPSSPSPLSWAATPSTIPSTFIFKGHRSSIMTKTRIPELFSPINKQPQEYEPFKTNHFANHKNHQQDGIGFCSKVSDMNQGSVRFMSPQNSTPHKYGSKPVSALGILATNLQQC